MLRIILMPVQQECLTPTRSGAIYFRCGLVHFLNRVCVCLPSHMCVKCSLQMCWSGFFGYILSLPLSILPKVENTWWVMVSNRKYIHIKYFTTAQMSNCCVSEEVTVSGLSRQPRLWLHRPVNLRSPHSYLFTGESKSQDRTCVFIVKVIIN